MAILSDSQGFPASAAILFMLGMCFAYTSLPSASSQALGSAEATCPQRLHLGLHLARTAALHGCPTSLAGSHWPLSTLPTARATHVTDPTGLSQPVSPPPRRSVRTAGFHMVSGAPGLHDLESDLKPSQAAQPPSRGGPLSPGSQCPLNWGLKRSLPASLASASQHPQDWQTGWQGSVRHHPRG